MEGSRMLRSPADDRLWHRPAIRDGGHHPPLAVQKNGCRLDNGKAESERSQNDKPVAQCAAQQRSRDSQSQKSQDKTGEPERRERLARLEERDKAKKNQ